MQMHAIPFATTDWSAIPREEKTADAGRVFWRAQQFGDIRVRMVEYTPGYVSDHWCVKGHVLLSCRASCTPSWPTAAASRSRPA